MTIENIEKKVMNVPFEIKKEDVEETGIFKGYGSVFGNKDSHNDVVMPGAFIQTIIKGGRNGNGVAMLYQHDARRPIGIWNSLSENKKGLKVEGQLAMKTQDGKETYELMKMGALKGLSIGYNSIVDEIDREKNVRFIKEVDLWEISPVTFASNTRATVIAVKEFKGLLQKVKTERELEKALRESDIFSKNDAQHVISLIKAVLRDLKPVVEKDDSGLSTILDDLKSINKDMEMTDILDSLQNIK
ncbi:MAG: HK97 family phage prohead protease [Deltaproteobacteria bacterium]|nr:HK97 family phage prohead protease [Deltaproteobacteria bacterium]MBW2363567.1 HK97 family phage prohead protease [Deltaproteobacteria bacterium]